MLEMKDDKDALTALHCPRKVWIVLPIAFRQRSAPCPFSCSIPTGALAKGPAFVFVVSMGEGHLGDVLFWVCVGLSVWVCECGKPNSRESTH